MKLNRVLVIFKNPKSFHGADAKYKNHVATINHVCSVLKKHKIGYHAVPREQIWKDISRDRHVGLRPPRDDKTKWRMFDLLITIGGDGTVLAASHMTGRTPILGVNSLPKTSRGFFCISTKKTFDKYLTEIIKNSRRPITLPLLETILNKKKLPCLALNDILFTAKSPAETVRYTIKIGSKKEEQRSSGVWISAGPGSTAGILAAGGKKMPVTSKKLQFLVREPCPAPNICYHLKHGFVADKKPICIISESSEGMVFIDGIKFSHPLPHGSTLKVSISSKHLNIFL